MNLEIANRLVALRHSQSISQEELAVRLGVSRQAVSKWERAESAPDTDNLIALARLYGVSLDTLLLGTPDTADGGGAAVNEDEQVFAAADDWEQAELERQQAQKQSRRRRLLAFPYPVAVTILFCILGFFFDFWHPGWMLYLTVPIYYCMAAAL